MVARHERVSIDLGTGDGRAVLAAAARDPRQLAIGLDADASSMADASRRAARPVPKGGLANILFAVAAAERVPAEVKGLGTVVTVTFPWGSLLRGCVGLDPAVADGVRSLVARGGRLELLLAPAERDRLPGVPTEPDAVVEACRATFEGLGLAFREGGLTSEAELRGSSSSWARRLISEGRERRAVRVRFASP